MLRDRFVVKQGERPQRDERFPIASCRIDNYTSSWWQISPDDVIIPPFSIGFLVNFFVHSNVFKIFEIPQPFAPNDPPQTKVSASFPSIVLVSLFDTQVPEGTPAVLEPDVSRSFQFAGGATPRPLDVNNFPTELSIFDMVVAFQWLWTAGLGNGQQNEQARGITQLGGNFVACAANVWTTVMNEFATMGRFAYFALSTDTPGRVDFKSDDDFINGVGYASFYLGAFIPVAIPIPSANMYLGSTGGHYQVRHSVGGSVALSLGWGPN